MNIGNYSYYKFGNKTELSPHEAISYHAGRDLRGPYGDQMAQLAQLDQDRIETLRRMGGGRRGGGGGRRASETQREREAVARLLGSLRDELDVLRETDPIAREMIQHREALKGATDAERDAVRELIEQRRSEEAQLQSLTEQQGFYRDIAYDAFDGLVLKGQSVTEVLGNIAAAAAQAFAQAALLGQGPLAGLFGTTPGVGLLNLIFPSPQGLATGGMVYGPGSETSDSVPTLLSAGEFVVNATATREHRALLEMINSGGSVMRLAKGGPVLAGPMPTAPMAPIAPSVIVAGNDPAEPAASGGVVRVLVSASPLLRAEITETSKGVTAELLESYDRDVLPGSLERVSGDARSVG